ncbi:hypothetical protein OEZ86_008680 [Tetradesmus obliquus]|nr:hypothetical protein OEZ86_008680 [Tetradesmus obliquus]
MDTSDALCLAQQLTAAGLCPVLAAAADTAEQRICHAEPQQQQQQQQPGEAQLELMHSGALLLRLALAVAAVWPGGILKSNTARCLAEPTVRLAVTVLQRTGRHHAAAGMRLAILQPVAAFAAELVLAAASLHKNSSNSSRNEAVPGPSLATAGLDESLEFLELALLVLHGQLAHCSCLLETDRQSHCGNSES